MKTPTAVAIAALLALSGSVSVAAADCNDHGACLTIYDPVCGSDGKTYGNACELDRAKCTVPGLVLSSNGGCPGNATAGPTASPAPSPSPTSECPVTQCTAIGAPVCGSDNKTYGNECELRVAKCAGATTLKIVSNGACGTGTGGGAGTGTGSGANSPGKNNVGETNAPSPAPTPSPTGGATSVGAATALLASSVLFVIALTI